MTKDEAEAARIEIDRQRLELERQKLAREDRFWARHSGVLIPAAVSFAAVIVSLGQVWVTKITQDKELEISGQQRSLELFTQDQQRAKELAVIQAQKDREFDLEVAKFVLDQRAAIFSGTPEQRELAATTIATVFPPLVASQLLQRIEQASQPSAKPAWQLARTSLPPAIRVVSGCSLAPALITLPGTTALSLTLRATRASDVTLRFTLAEGSPVYFRQADGRRAKTIEKGLKLVSESTVVTTELPLVIAPGGESPLAASITVFATPNESDAPLTSCLVAVL